jgi:two-component system sensor histidine kinase/response regulator
MARRCATDETEVVMTMPAPLPVVDQASAGDKTEDVPGRPNILIVDDRKENLLATERVLRRLDAGIFKAGSGGEALSLVLRHRFAIVLLDVQMPEMDGFETAMLMQDHKSMTGVPIIFVTAISKEEKYATQAAEIGAVDYIFKPINPDILRSKVKVYLDLYVQREHILRLNEKLKNSNEELERFAYICSHDMQEPARMMSCYADLIHEDYEDKLGATGRKYLSFIADNARHMQKMIVDILDFSRAGWEKPQIETVDCGKVLADILKELEPSITEAKARIVSRPLPVIDSSLTLIHVLLQNLVGNALKFQNGERPPEIGIKAERNESGWLFTIQDNGIGIEPEFGDRVFAIFQRIHRREKYPGTGIGLSTCRKLVELYGGKIWFDSIPGQGSVFYFTLPDQPVLQNN